MWDVYDFINRHGVSLEQTYPYTSENGENNRECLGVNG